MINFLLEALELKEEKRTGWELRNVEDPESVADHTWGTSFLTLVYGEEEDVDIDRCLKIALVHDIAEHETGDLVTRAESQAQEIAKEDKHQMESEVLKRISAKLNSEKILELWKEYEKKESPEARFVKDMDMIDLCLTALKYEKSGRYDPEEENDNFQKYDNLDEFFVTTEPRIKTETGQRLFDKIKQRYEEAKEQ